MRFGLLGFPIDYSLSPKIHEMFASQSNININYHLILTRASDLPNRLHQLLQEGYRGVNLTQPLKKIVLNYVSSQSNRVQSAHAANTLSFTKNKEIEADNTDGIGLVRALQSHVPYNIQGKRVLIIGAGGAASGIVPELLKLPLREVSIINRTLPVAESLCQRNTSLLPYCQSIDYDWIINTTTLRVYQLPTVFPQIIFDNKIVYDINYCHSGPELASFLKQHKPLTFFNGLSMLVEQAAYAFSIWHGLQPDTKTVLEELVYFLKKSL